MQLDVMKRVKQARTLALLTVAFGVLFYGIGATIKPGYSSVSSFISELNATDTAWASALGYLGFIPLGILFAMFLITAHSLAQVEGASKLGWWLLWSQPIAFIGVALAPCDAGCPLGGSLSQDIHDILGVVTYFSAGIGLLLLSRAKILSIRSYWARYILLISGISFFVIFVVMLLPDVAPIRGLLQRIADLLLATSLIVIAWFIVEPDLQINSFNNSFKNNV